jgi:hypothetical protein
VFLVHTFVIGGDEGCSCWDRFAMG